MSKKQFTTTIDEDIQNKFKEKCLEDCHRMNDVLEAFMNSYVQDELIVEKEIKFSLRRK